MNDWIAAIILGIIEGLTEFLPISSTGHLLIAQNWLSAFRDWTPGQQELFTVIIQPAAVLSVIAVFYNRLRQMATDFRNPQTFDYIVKLTAAFVITGAGGLVLTKLHFTLPKTIAPIAWATLIGGVVILLIERCTKGKEASSQITWLAAATVGVAQLVAAVFPGTSRSGACILFAMLVGLSRPAATEFSFLVGIPTMLAAGALEVHKALKESGHAQSDVLGVVVLGAVVSAITAFLVVKWLLRFVQHHDFKCFGWYRIVMGSILLVLLATHVIHRNPEPAAPAAKPAQPATVKTATPLQNNGAEPLANLHS